VLVCEYGHSYSLHGFVYVYSYSVCVCVHVHSYIVQVCVHVHSYSVQVRILGLMHVLTLNNFFPGMFMS
jgi:hypothetical protein